MHLFRRQRFVWLTACEWLRMPLTSKDIVSAVSSQKMSGQSRRSRGLPPSQTLPEDCPTQTVGRCPLFSSQHSGGNAGQLWLCAIEMAVDTRGTPCCPRLFGAVGARHGAVLVVLTHIGAMEIQAKATFGSQQPSLAGMTGWEASAESISVTPEHCGTFCRTGSEPCWDLYLMGVQVVSAGRGKSGTAALVRPHHRVSESPHGQCPEARVRGPERPCPHTLANAIFPRGPRSKALERGEARREETPRAVAQSGGP